MSATSRTRSTSFYRCPQPLEIAPAGVGTKAIEALVETLVRHANPSYPLDPFRLAETLGGGVKLVNFWSAPDDAASLAVHDRGDFQIYVELHAGRHRKHYEIAKAIGHYVLHYTLPILKTGTAALPNWFPHRGSGPAEREASRFALALLMPRALFLAAHDTLHDDEVAIATRFDVDRRDVTLRKASLQLPSNTNRKILTEAIPAAVRPTAERRF